MAKYNKICVAEHQIWDNDLDIQAVGHNGAEEYINKNELITWLEKKIAENSTAENWCAKKADAFNEVISKINSL